MVIRIVLPDKTASNGHRIDSVSYSKPILKAMIFGTPITPHQQPQLGPSVAIDCEMVGVGGVIGYRVQNGKRAPMYRSALARVSIVDLEGHLVLDQFVNPGETVKDYRTAVSGVRPQDLKGAMSLREAQNLVRKILEDHIVIGHALHNDFAVGYFHVLKIRN